jgi:hypothetical protein
MFERFTKEARQIVKAAVAEAGARGDSRIGSEHLLIALAGAPLPFSRTLLGPLDVGPSVIGDQLDRMDSESLATVGFDPDLLHPSLRGARSAGRSKSGRHIPFTHGAKAALEGALRAAIRRGDRHIGAEHVLLSLLSVPPEDPVARVLVYLEVDPAKIRADVEAALARRVA